MKILTVRKRNAFMRFWSISHYHVRVEMNDGSVKEYNVWADLDAPNRDSLLWDLRRQIHGETHETRTFKELEGTEL